MNMHLMALAIRLTHSLMCAACLPPLKPGLTPQEAHSPKQAAAEAAEPVTEAGEILDAALQSVVQV
jgi:hypothetical protein